MVNTQPTRKPSSYARLILTGFIRKPHAFAGAFSHVYLLLHQNVGQGSCRCLAHKGSSTLPMVARLAGLYLVVASWIMSSDNGTSTARTLYTLGTARRRLHITTVVLALLNGASAA